MAGVWEIKTRREWFKDKRTIITLKADDYYCARNDTKSLLAVISYLSETRFEGLNILQRIEAKLKVVLEKTKELDPIHQQLNGPHHGCFSSDEQGSLIKAAKKIREEVNKLLE